MMRGRILRRRAVAVTGAAGAVVAAVLLLGGDEGSEDERSFAPPPGVSAAAIERLSELSAERKVDQLLLTGFNGARPSQPLLAQLGQAPPGGLLVAAANWGGVEPGSKLIERIRKSARDSGSLEPLIVTRQEGGLYRSLADLPPAEREIEIGDFAQRDRAMDWAEGTAQALADAGFDLNLAPVADIATLDSPIADRAFSDDAGVAAAMTAAAVRGCHRGGLGCAVSHFPGLGGASQDTGSGPATVSVDLPTLQSRDLLPFVAAFQQRADAVVVSNALYAAFDPVTPASLSPEISTGLLRDELGFEGVAITDDLEAGAIRAGLEVPEAAVDAVIAGADMVQISAPVDVERTRRALREAVASGEIDPDRLDAAVARVLELKHRRGLL